MLTKLLARRRATGKRTPAWVAVAPLSLVYLVFFLGPEVYFLRASFYRTNSFGVIGGAATLSTWKSIANAFYLHVLFQTLLVCVLVALFATILAYSLAYTIVKSKRYGRPVFIVVIATMFSSAVALVLGWEVLLSPVGPVARALVDLHVVHKAPTMLNNLFGVVLGTVQAVLPIATIALMPAFAQVKEAQIDAAASLGAGTTRTFFAVTLPQTAATTIGVSLLVFAVTAGAFTTPALLGGGKVDVLSVIIYSVASQGLNYSTAAALSIVLMLVVAAVVGLALLTRGRSNPGTDASTQRAPVGI